MFSLQCMRSLILCAFINLMLCSLYLCFTDFAENNLKYAYVSVEAKEHQHLNTLPQNVNVFEKHLTVHSTPQINSVAHGSFSNAVNETGWGYLEVFTNADFSSELQAYGASVVEAKLSKDFISLHWYNRWTDICDEDPGFCSRLRGFLQRNMDFLLESIQKHPQDEYWNQVKLLLCQLAGLRDQLFGKVSLPDIKFDMKDEPTFKTMMMQLSGDIETLTSVFNGTQSTVLGSGSCSALIKLAPDNSELFVAHATFTGYQRMLRILKKYNLNIQTVHGNKIPGSAMSISSYPGSILSVDDFYLLSSGLAVIETTLDNNNPDLWNLVKPESLLTWMRVLIANRLSENGRAWMNTFKLHNSGTYNNQWMVVDYKQFIPGQPLKNGTLMVLEQMPGTMISDDFSEHLDKFTYWPSYNSAYFPVIFNISNQQELVDKYGPWFTYDGTPRARIFKRDHHKASDMRGMRNIMRYNDYTHDPLSTCNCTPPYSAENAIAARSDLNMRNGTYPFPALSQRAHGATDMKLTNSTLFKALQFEAISGPTSDQQPAFSWLTTPYKSSVKHRGQPITFNFTSIVHRWT